MVVPFDYPTCSSESKMDAGQHTPLLLGLVHYTTAVYMGISVSHTHHDKMATVVGLQSTHSSGSPHSIWCSEACNQMLDR